MSLNSEFTAEQLALVNEIMACNGRDLYTIVGTDKEASFATIRKSYKELALKLHPDKNHAPRAAQAFIMVTKAMQILSNPMTRQHYDNYYYLCVDESANNDEEWDSDDDEDWVAEDHDNEECESGEDEESEIEVDEDKECEDFEEGHPLKMARYS